MFLVAQRFRVSERTVRRLYEYFAKCGEAVPPCVELRSEMFTGHLKAAPIDAAHPRLRAAGPDPGCCCEAATSSGR